MRKLFPAVTEPKGRVLTSTRPFFVFRSPQARERIGGVYRSI